MKFFKSTDLNSIKILSFDLDNTIYDCQSVLTKAENWFTDYLCDTFELGGKCREYRFWKDIKSEVLKADPSLSDDVTYLRAVSLVEAFKRLRMPLAGGIKQAQELVELFIAKRSAGVIDDKVLKLLTDLHAKYPMFAISNGNLDKRVLKIDSFFERDYRPQIGTFRAKPHEDLFVQCARDNHVKIDEILHIGDDPLTDVCGAVNAGCRCAWVYRGYTGISDDEHHLRILPDILLDNVLELEQLLLN